MMALKRKLTCIRCPTGCEILTTLDGYEIMEIEGNACKLGEEYVRAELKDPRRVITSLVKVRNGRHPVCPVWTSTPVPKNRIPEILNLLRTIEIEAPIASGQVIIRNVLGTGSDIIASRQLGKADEITS
jgi:CxxC motif-containing protein